MKLLLDTHIWLWCLLEPDRLAPPVRRALNEVETELWLSPISVWEALLLADKGRLALDDEAHSWLAQALARVPMREAPLSFAIARESRRIQVPHQDPADRFLAATALVLGLTLVTSDRRLLAARGLSVLPNT